MRESERDHERGEGKCGREERLTDKRTCGEKYRQKVSRCGECNGESEKRG